MKNKITLGLAVALLACLTFMGFAQKGEPGSDKLKVLIIDGQNNHNWKATTPVLEDSLTSSGRFAVDVSTFPGKKASDEEWANFKPDFSKYDIIVGNYNGKLWPGHIRTAFVDFVKSGGGYVVVHAADNAFTMWTEYNEMIGLGGWNGRNEKSGPYVYYKDDKLVTDTSKGHGGSHGPQHEFLINNRAPEHPITKGMPTSWLHAKDELYDRLRGPAKNMKVLATAPCEPTKRDEPMLMALTYGQGRIFHTTLGHADYSMKCRGFYATIQRGAEWAGTGNVTIPWPEDMPGKDKVVPVALSK